MKRIPTLLEKKEAEIEFKFEFFHHFPEKRNRGKVDFQFDFVSQFYLKKIAEN